MLTLTLWNTAETSQYTIDLYDHAPVNLNYQFSDVTEINKAKGSYSQTFRIPATKSNTNFFGRIDNPTQQPTSNFSVKKKIRATLSYSTIPLMNGYVQVKNMYVQKKDFADIELIFFGETLDLVRSLQEEKLADLDTSTIDHFLNITNLQTSWTVGAFPFDGTVRYGIMDKGQNWSEADGTITPFGTTSATALNQSDYTPYISAKWLIDNIITTAGFTYTSDFFDTADFANVFLPAYNGSLVPRSIDNESEAQVCGVNLAANVALPVGSYVLVPFVDSFGGYDYSNNWTNAATYKFTAPYNCMLTCTLNVVQTQFGGIVHIVLNNTTTIGSAQTSSTNTSNTSFNFTLEAGDTISVIAQSTTAGNFLVAPTSSGWGGGNSSFFRVDSVTEPFSGQEVTMSLNFPDLKQIDFLTSLQKMFNLVFVPDKNTPKHLIIEPYQDYISAGTQKDWTNKIDFTKDVVIRPTTDIQKNVYEWTNDVGQDFLNVAIQASNARTYGRYKVEDKDNDFATGELVLKTAFSPYVLSYIPSSEVAIYRCIDNGGGGVQKPKAHLTYWCGLTLLYGTTWIYNDSVVPVSTTFFPVFSNYSATFPSVADNDLNFGYEIAFVDVQAHPLNTLYYKYWMSYVNELYSESSRLMTAYIKLTRADIQDFEFSDRIFIKDTYYRILKISNYDATTGGVVQVDLIKILSDVADCAYTPTGQLTSGVITFNSSASNYGNQSCCERYGYIWVSRKVGTSQCYPTSLANTPTI
tara:strand:- start:2048 stop:4297 length:2250 start_codon:yes stop_codon:yes gene_type:complete